MAACRTCGEKAGAFKDECRNCEGIRQQQEEIDRQERARLLAEDERQRREQEALELEQRTKAFIDDAIASFRKALEQGRTPYLYSLVGVSVPYRLLDQDGGSFPDLHDLSMLGRDGWEVVATLPQTAGIGLSNVYQRGGGTTWAGGIGGIVTGVFLLLRLQVTAQTLAQHEDLLRKTLREQYEDDRSFADSSQILIPGSNPGSDQGGGMSPMATMAMGAAGVALLTSTFDDYGDEEGGGDSSEAFEGDYDF